MLTRKEILEIASGDKIWPHPVVKAIDEELLLIERAINGSSGLRSDEMVRSIRTGLGSFADTVEQIRGFALESGDILSIGVRLNVIPRSRDRNACNAGMTGIVVIICSSYAAMEMDDDICKGFPRHFLEHQTDGDLLKILPQRLRENPSSLEYIKTRAFQILDSTRQLSLATYKGNAEPIAVIN